MLLNKVRLERLFIIADKVRARGGNVKGSGTRYFEGMMEGGHDIFFYFSSIFLDVRKLRMK